MPIKNGIEALREIMSVCPTPVVMLSSLTDAGNVLTIQALEIGAVDFVKKPSGSISVDLYKVKDRLMEKLRTALHAKLQPKQEAHTESLTKPSQPPLSRAERSNQFRHLVAIGTSTGGPKALQRVLPALPKHFPAPILIVQHMPPNFTRSLAGRLDVLSQIRVVEAEQNMPVESGTAYIAPGGWHMGLSRTSANQYAIQLSKDAPRNGHRPSVDVLFESLYERRELKRHLVLMTGMGGDGAHAMKLLRDSGVETAIAEAEETCIVFGMPKVAIELQAVTDVLPLHEIPRKLIEVVR
jgi:two-component system chemotaxis response regulator CheB